MHGGAPYIRPATATCHVVKMATSTLNTDAKSTVIWSSENVDSVDSEGGSDDTSSSSSCQRPVASLLRQKVQLTGLAQSTKSFLLSRHLLLLNGCFRYYRQHLEVLQFNRC